MLSASAYLDAVECHQLLHLSLSDNIKVVRRRDFDVDVRLCGVSGRHQSDVLRGTECLDRRFEPLVEEPLLILVSAERSGVDLQQQAPRTPGECAVDRRGRDGMALRNCSRIGRCARAAHLLPDDGVGRNTPWLAPVRQRQAKAGWSTSRVYYSRDS